jgi:SAM-dependent methyltransferase
MPQPNQSRPDYANWVSSKLIYLPGTLAVLFSVLSILSPWFALLAAPLIACSGYFAYARRAFSAQGGAIQSRIQALVLQRLHWDGKGQVLDIGCGNGPLTIAIAKTYPTAHVTGIDSWRASWEYSKAVCERNATIEGVAKAVTFQRASAAALPFDDETFDVVVSNLVFHEVRDVRDKRLLLKEALRVLKKGGLFVFQDLFLWRRVYGEVADLLSTTRAWGVESADLVPTNNSQFIPRTLKLPFMVGTIAIVHGRK